MPSSHAMTDALHVCMLSTTICPVLDHQALVRAQPPIHLVHLSGSPYMHFIFTF